MKYSFPQKMYKKINFKKKQKTNKQKSTGRFANLLRFTHFNCLRSLVR